LAVEQIKPPEGVEAPASHSNRWLEVSRSRDGIPLSVLGNLIVRGLAPLTTAPYEYAQAAKMSFTNSIPPTV